MACNISSVSAPRHSPITILSGLIRREFITKSLVEISPSPSMFLGLVSSLTTCSCCKQSSAESSIVIILSPEGILADKLFNNVVLPAPVPPEIIMLHLARTAACSTSAISVDIEPHLNKASIVPASFLKRLIESEGPSIASGGIMAFTRLPSASLASTIGDFSSILLPTFETILSIIFFKWSLSLKVTDVL